jgi:inorganic pyrophosphatase/exopolyphosphatase
MILDLKYRLDDYSVDGEADYIELDVSKPDFFDKRVTEDNLVEIIDHHVGYEEYWRKRPKVKSQIEFIGSVCTIIYERIIESKHEEILDTDLCKLLIAGILDNTLNLKSDITSDRDRAAYSELMRIGGISDDYCVEYFSACEAEIVNNFAQAIRDDIKIEKVGALPEVIGQMVLLSSAIARSTSAPMMQRCFSCASTAARASAPLLRPGTSGSISSMSCSAYVSDSHARSMTFVSSRVTMP